MKREIHFETTDLKQVKRKIEAFKTLFGKPPARIEVGGVVHSKGYGKIRIYGFNEVTDIRRKYFAAEIDGEEDDNLTPAFGYGSENVETRWTLHHR